MSTSPDKEYPVSEQDFGNIRPGDLVRYQTTQTGHRVGIVRGRERVKTKPENAAPLVATVGQHGKRTVTLTREQLMEWRPKT